MRRIAFVAHLSEISGSGVALLETVAAFSAKGYKALMILPGEGPLAERARNRGIEPVIVANAQVGLAESGAKTRLKLALARVKYVYALRKLLAAEKINLVYVNTSASIFPAVAARLAGIPVAWHIHETLARSQNTSLKKRMIVRWASGLIYASKSAMEAFPPPPGMPALLARNYVNLDEIAASVRARPQYSTDAREHPLILCNGVYRLKGADILLDALRLLQNSAPDLQPVAVIAGNTASDPDFYKELQHTLSRITLSDRVRFPGLQPSLSPLLAEASVFVSASRSEALPIALVEAMAAGVPVIATDVGDCAELLDYGKCGWVVLPESPVGIAAALHEALTQPELAHAKTARAIEKISRLYNPANFWEPLENFLLAL